MRKLILSTLALMMLSAPAFAKEIVNVTVNGMVCDFCAQSVLKVFEKNEGVENIDIDLDTGIVAIHMKDGAEITDAEIEKNIDYSGYGLVKIERMQSE